jgi:hypothetical protein
MTIVISDTCPSSTVNGTTTFSGIARTGYRHLDLFSLRRHGPSLDDPEGQV